MKDPGKGTVTSNNYIVEVDSTNDGVRYTIEKCPITIKWKEVQELVYSGNAQVWNIASVSVNGSTKNVSSNTNSVGIGTTVNVNGCRMIN